jgi:hypothetical protein
LVRNPLWSRVRISNSSKWKLVSISSGQSIQMQLMHLRAASFSKIRLDGSNPNGKFTNSVSVYTAILNRFW